MDSLEEEKRRIKKRRENYFNNKCEFLEDGEEKKKNYVNGLIARLLIGLIVFFGILIATNFNGRINNFVHEKILKENMSFTKLQICIINILVA